MMHVYEWVKLYHAITCNTIQYHELPCNTMQYHAPLITADGAYHCPVVSIRTFFHHSHMSLVVLSLLKKQKNFQSILLLFFFFSSFLFFASFLLLCNFLASFFLLFVSWTSRQLSLCLAQSLAWQPSQQ